MIKQRWDKWIRTRFSYRGKKQIKQNEVYVFLNPQGYVYLILLLITFIAGINYANNLILGLCFLLSSILCLSFFMAFRQLYQLNIQLSRPEVLQVGEVGQLAIILSVPEQSNVTQRWLTVLCADQTQHIHVKDQTTLQLQLWPTQRGQYQLPLIQLRSTYPFGLVKAWTYVFEPEPIWVAPEAIEENDLAYMQVRPIALNRPDDFKEIKSYQLGEPLNLVSWKHVAQGKGMQMKTFEATEHDQVDIDYEHFLHLEHETRLKVMMWLAKHYYMNQRPFRIKIKQQELPLGVDADHYLNTQLLLAQQP